MTKTLTFAILHFTVAFSVAYLLTGSIAISSTVALVEPIVNTVAFFFHEKAWQRFESKRRLKQDMAQQHTDHQTAATCCVHHQLFVGAQEAGEAVKNNTPNPMPAKIV
ncbi:putative membrane protein [Vitreoscilla sp. C1]|nr:putative membrane protein [Vitreoscilla sp. C1]